MTMLDHCIVGDCRDGMRQMITDGVKAQTVVTSPPYWGLRDYGTGKWEGGDAACDHARQLGGTHSSTLHQWNNGLTATTIAEKVNDYGRASYGDRCGKCGARRVDRQLGLERTPLRYLARMRSVFRLVRELLADDGTLWLNMGDSYYSPRWNGGVGSNSRINGQGTQEEFRRAQGLRQGSSRGDLTGNKNQEHQDACSQNRARSLTGLKPKDMVGMPWLLALALRADGWYLRRDIIWHKPNPMPESVDDRPATAHEYIFLLTKSERYYYNAEAIKEPVTGNAHARGSGVNPKAARFPAGWASGEEPHSTRRHNTPGAGDRKFRPRQNASFSGAVNELVDSRNKRSVWSVATQPFPDAHFAVFPEKLIEPCILAGSRPGDVVFDPFMGSGTVAAVATRLGRSWLGCELNPEYVELQTPRAAQRGLAL